MNAQQKLARLMAGHPVMAILRNTPPADSVRLAMRAWDLGIDMVEVPIQEPECVPSLRAVVSAGRERGMPVGAGTVVDHEQLSLVSSIGVDFAVAPGLDLGLARHATREGIPFLPGVATPTEVQSALSAGFDWVKAFPATALGLPWFRAMHGPFPGVSLVATGGIDASNAADYLQAGASMVAVGSALDDAAQLDELSLLLRDRKVH